MYNLQCIITSVTDRERSSLLLQEATDALPNYFLKLHTVYDPRDFYQMRTIEKIIAALPSLSTDELRHIEQVIHDSSRDFWVA